MKIFLGAAAVYGVLRVIGAPGFLRDDAEGIAALLQIIGTLYSVLYAFATYVIWGQFTAVENEVLKESGSLKDLLVFSQPLPEKTRDPIVRAVRNYARAVVDTEWKLLSRIEASEKADRLFGEIPNQVAEIKPQDDAQKVIFERLLELASQASAHREERLALSVERMPKTLFAFVTLTAGMMLLLVVLYPYHRVVLGLTSVVITSIILFFAHFVLTDLDNPFEGSWNVTCDPFDELATHSR